MSDLMLRLWIRCFNDESSSGNSQKEATDILARFKEDPNSWTKVDAILESSNFLEQKYFGLQILEQLIQTRWKALPREQCEGIKGYIREYEASIAETEHRVGADRQA
uniref:Importin N-terminal domain-containing protein n=1 Tax=Ditylenchus dipsaci TaxID=166011 RepID=A0A915DDM2_9BILA